MLNLTVRFTGPDPAPFEPMTMETIEVSFSGTQRAAVTQATSIFSGVDETVRQRNYRLRQSARKMGAMLEESICQQLRSMGHAV